MASTDNEDNGTESGKPDLDHEKVLTSLKDIESSTTLTNKDFKALRIEIHVFVETYSEECEKTPRVFKKQPWSGLVDRFVESEGKGDKYWDPTRDEYNGDTHLSWPDDREDIRFLVFCLLKKEATAQAKKQRTSNAAELGDNDTNGAAASPTPVTQVTKKRKDNTVADSPTSPPAKKKARKADNNLKEADVNTPSEQNSVYSEGDEEGDTIEVRDFRDSPDYLAPAKAQHEKQVKAAAAKPVNSLKQGKGLFKSNTEGSAADPSAIDSAKSTSTPRALSSADIEKSKFTSSKTGTDSSKVAKAALITKKRAADSEVTKEPPAAKAAPSGKKAKVDDDGKKALVAKDHTPTSKGKDEAKPATKASIIKQTKDNVQCEPTGKSFTTEKGEGQKKDAKAAATTTNTSVTEQKEGNAGVLTVKAASPKAMPMLEAHIQPDQAKPKADSGQDGEKDVVSVEVDTMAPKPSLFGPLRIVGEKTNGVNDNQGLNTNDAREGSLANVQGAEVATEEIDRRTSPALLSNPTPVSNISDEFPGAEFTHIGLKISQETGPDSERATALLKVETLEMVEDGNGSVGKAASRGATSDREMTRERSVGQHKFAKPSGSITSTNEAASSLMSPVNTLRSPTIPISLNSLPDIVITIDIETPSYQMSSSQMLNFHPSIDWVTFYGRVVLELTNMDKHALMDAQSVNFSSAALPKPVLFKVGVAAEGMWKHLMKKIAAAEEEEVEVCFQ